MSEHTPTPWALSGMAARGLYGNSGELAIIAADYRVCTVDCVADFKRGSGHVAKCDERDANAEFIVRACNSHDELLNALRRLSELTPGAANAATAHDLHLSVKAIADSAISSATGDA